MEKRILVLTVENKVGVLSRITGVFSRKMVSIHAINAQPLEDNNFTQIRIEVAVTDVIFRQLVLQLNKLVVVLEVIAQ